MIEVNPPQCRLVDLGSRNGTYVNGRPVHAVDLCHNDVIKGGSTLLRISMTDRLGHPLPTREGMAGQLRAQPTRTIKPTAGQDSRRSPRLLPPWKARPADRSKSARAPAIPGYEILDELGHGGMGVVYLARREADDAKLAIKTIHPACTTSERDVQRFLREAQILCTLRHPHIVAFHQMGRIGDQFYFVMDYVAGTDGARLAAHGPMTVPRAVGLICQALEALDYAHRRGVVHRDIKPANLLVHGGPPRETCRVADFGLARVYQESKMSGLTMLGDVGGTLPFMPPEQITNYREVLPAADQYSAAATLYYLLAGAYLYDFPTSGPEHKKLIKILVEPPVPILQRRDDLPPGLSIPIHRALEKDPKKRFSSVGAFREALAPLGRYS
jgi:serine/threonine-protein kinase